jgi:TetR/AcrR family transcriptional regulator, transcriptional repressor for nem operon
VARTSSDTRQVLIDTALALIWMSSYGSVSVDDICKAAGVKKGSFYHFFPSKVDLAVAAMDHSYQEVKSIYDTIFSPDRPPLERFERMAALVIEKQTETLQKYGRVCGCPDTSLSCEMAGLEERIRTKFDELANRKKRYYENALRDMVADGMLPEGTDVKAKAHEIFAYLLGQMTLARIQNDLELLKRDLMPGLLGLLGVQDKAKQAS